jgi:phage antirepressor YoqD-like protein
MLKMLQNNSAPTMTSREISELTGKDHGHVIRDIYKMLDQLGYTSEQKDGCHQEWIHPQNKQRYFEVVLNRDETLCLVAGYSAPLRLKIIQRWNELEQKQSQPESPLLQLANAVLTAQAIIADQSQKLLIAEPKAAALDLIAGSDDSRCIRDTAKDLKIKPSRLTQYLLANRWIYRQSRDDAKLGKVMAYQHRIDQGLIEHCSVVIEKKGQTKLATSVKITGKGFAKLSLEFSGEK